MPWSLDVGIQDFILFLGATGESLRKENTFYILSCDEGLILDWGVCFRGEMELLVIKILLESHWKHVLAFKSVNLFISLKSKSNKYLILQYK